MKYVKKYDICTRTQSTIKQFTKYHEVELGHVNWIDVYSINSYKIYLPLK